jgi:hypothetical protein
MRTPPADLRLYYLQRPPPTFQVPLQTYFPSLEQLFPSIAEQHKGSPTLAAKELVAEIQADSSVVEDLQTKERRTVPTWLRMVHLVEPVDAMSGEILLPTDGGLPTFREAWQRALRKLNDPYNEAYTDAVFACMASRLVETGRSPHFCQFYGTFNARMPEYKYNITDEIQDIQDEDWFHEGVEKGFFTILATDPANPDASAELKVWARSHKQRPRLVLDRMTASSAGSAGSAGPEDAGSEGSEILLVEADIEVSGDAVVQRPQIQLSRLGSVSAGSGSGSGSGSGASAETEDETEYFALLKNFPVQLTVLERCDGTLDDLMEDEIADTATDAMRETKEERWTAWIFQVIAGLVAIQQTYDCVHNDLHTNNVMWSGTGETHLYYHVAGAAGGDRYYRVPTYGRLMKIIDFGRATFRAGTDNRVWFPDAYAPDAVAGGQYNCGAYYEQGRPKVMPNKSFDLCRLSVSILDTLWQDPVEEVKPRRPLTREQAETTSPLWNLMWLWLTDREGRNVLRNPDGSERYPAFDLYCAIARDVQNAVPAQQLTLPLFDNVFRCKRKDIPTDATIWKLQAIVNAKK